MNPDQWAKISSLLDQALELPETQRATFLDRLRQQEPALCREVETLLEQELCTDRLQAPPTPLYADAIALTPQQGVEPLPPQLGNFRLVKVVGSGGMGVVYQAEDSTLRRQVALKVMKAEHAHFPLARLRFLREGRAAAAVQHEHVLPIFQVEEKDGIVFLVMPLLQGETLEERLQRTPILEVPELLR